MGRKNLLEHLLEPSDEAVAEVPVPRKAMGRGVGVIGAVSESIDSLESELADARSKIEGGQLIVEIPVDRIEASFVADRFDDGADMDDLVSSIRESGQSVPILVRPHPEVSERFQIAFGHRRVRAAKVLGLPVKAIIKHMTDAQLVIAQGQENQHRLNLSFIERATFAARLEEQGFPRTVICSAINVDKTELSRMISVAKAVPKPVVQAIGAARSVGRRKWMELAKALDAKDSRTLMEGVLELTAAPDVSSDDKFDAVLAYLLAVPKSGKRATRSDHEGGFSVDRQAGMFRIRFDEAAVPKQHIEDCLQKIREICDSYALGK